MTEFDVYVGEMEKRKQEQKREKINAVLQERLKKQTREQTMAMLKMVLGIETVTLQTQENSKYVAM